MKLMPLQEETNKLLEQIQSRQEEVRHIMEAAVLNEGDSKDSSRWNSFPFHGFPKLQEYMSCLFLEMAPFFAEFSCIELLHPKGLQLSMRVRPIKIALQCIQESAEESIS